MNHSSKHEEKKCAWCDAFFECKPGDVANCDCGKVKISADVYKYISEKYNDCLCHQCLTALSNKVILFTEKFGPSPH
jgi:Cysteine-rich CWC